MRTNIVLDDELVEKAMKLSGLLTKKAVIEQSLKLFVQLGQQKKLSKFFGKLQWDGDLKTMRSTK